MPFASAKSTRPEAWAINEFGTAQLGDRRRTNRLVVMATEFARQPTAAITQSAPDWAGAKAAYRLLDNEAVEAQAMSESHLQATLQRINQQAPPVVLALQDTTFLDYSNRPHRRLQNTTTKLWQRIEAGRVQGHHQVEVPTRGGRPARSVRLSVRFGSVELPAPATSSCRGTIQVWALSVRESRPPKGASALHWRLLSTVAISDLESAVQQVGWYACRWQIEELHKVLKSGCRVEDRRLENAQRLKRALAIDLVVAWRILALSKLARSQAEESVEGWLEEGQWRALQTHAQGGGAKRSAPRLGEAVSWIARLGGHLGRANDGPPGPMTLWRGLQRLNDLELMWRLCHEN